MRFKRTITYLLIVGILFITACAGKQANPIPVYLPGDENRSCKGLQAEIAQLDADMARLAPETDKFLYNAIMVAGGILIIAPFFFVDLKDSEKTEWEAMRVRRNKNRAASAENALNPHWVSFTPGTKLR